MAPDFVTGTPVSKNRIQRVLLFADVPELGAGFGLGHCHYEVV